MSWTGYTQGYRHSFRPHFILFYLFFLSHSPVHLDRVSSASSSTPRGPISAHVHFAQQIISNVVRRGVKRERVKNKEEREWPCRGTEHAYRKPRVAQVFSWIPGLVFMRYSSFFFTFDRPDYRFQKFAKCGYSFFFSTASFGLEERIYRDESVRFFSIRVNVK